MLSLYEILKASKTGIAPDLWTHLAAEKMAGDSEKVRELTGELPLTFTANGKPLLDYTIYGNMEQAGAPTPTAPIQPSECGDRTKNLFDKDNADITHLYPLLNGTTFTQGGDNSWSIIIPCKPNTTYVISNDILPGAAGDRRHRVSGSDEYPTVGGAQTFVDDSSETVSGDPRTRQIFTTTADTHWIVCFLFYTASYETTIEQIQSIQLEEANDKTEYEPYGYKLPISSAGQTNNIYLGEVETTRYVKQLVLTGEENWIYDSNGSRCYINITDAYAKNNRRTQCYCSHYICVYNGEPFNTIPNHSIYINLYYNAARFYIKNEEFTSADDFKSFLAAQYAAGTPVCVWYVLATPETAVVNEPLRKIGDYADTVSMEQAGVSISTLNGQTVVDVDTTLKPSEVYIKYKG